MKPTERGRNRARIRILPPHLLSCLVGALMGVGYTTHASVPDREGDAADRDPVAFAVYAERSLVVQRGVRIRGGAVGVASRRADTNSAGDFPVSLHGARIRGDVYGRTVFLGDGTHVRNVYTDRLVTDTGPGCAAGRVRFGEVFPFPAGGLPAVPVAPDAEVGELPLIVPPGSRQVLAGSPNVVRLGAGATLVLEGGEYRFETLAMESRSRLEALSTSRLILTQSLEAGPETYIGPARGEPVLNLSIVVAGADVNGVPRASIGERARVRALLSVPDGTLRVNASVRASGAYQGRNVWIGADASIEHFPGLNFSQSEPCVAPFCRIDAVGGGTIEWTCSTEPLPAGTPCDDGNACTDGDACNGLGLCLSGDPVPDPDPFGEDPCLKDVCDPASGIHEPAGTVCSTSLFPCRDAVCTPNGSCGDYGPPYPQGTACDDGIPNNGPDTCTANGFCAGALGPFDCLANNCSSSPGAPPDLACWLDEHPSIKTAIRWIEPLPPDATTTVLWDAWEPWRKAELQQAFDDAWAWYDGGMTSFPGTVIPDPPPNLQALADNDTPVTVFDAATVAWPLYLAHVAHALMVEIKGLVPWSLCEYPYQWELFELLQANAYYWQPQGAWPDYQVFGTVTPTHPTITFSFLVQNGLIGQTRLETITNVMGWARRLRHFIGPFTAKNMENHWQYRGEPPMSRILQGTVIDPDAYPGFPNAEHWTKGCWGTSGFFKELLRAVNIPVRYEGVPFPACPHATPLFLPGNRYLSHGDDLYTAFWREGATTVVPPMEDFLIDQPTYTAWFGGTQNDACNNVGRRGWS